MGGVKCRLPREQRVALMGLDARHSQLGSPITQGPAHDGRDVTDGSGQAGAYPMRPGIVLGVSYGDMRVAEQDRYDV